MEQERQREEVRVTERYPSAFRLKNTAQFSAVFQARHRASDRLIILYCRANELPHSRLGLSVSRRVGNAVVRNRWKRLLREVFRRNRAELPTGCDFVVVPQKQARMPQYADVLKSFMRLARKITPNRVRDQASLPNESAPPN